MYHLQVVTPEQVMFDDEIVALIAPGEDGYLGVLTDHAPIIASLKAGVLIITDKHDKKLYYQVSAGFLEVNHNHASIIVETIEPTAPVNLGLEEGL